MYYVALDFVGMTNLFAHTPASGSQVFHDLGEHLAGVADRASELASKFGAGEIGSALGLIHDLAKADPRFQLYLQECFEGKKGKSCPHATPSAAAAKHILGLFVIPVIGHHAGMPNACELREKLDNVDNRSVEAANELMKSFDLPKSLQSSTPEWALKNPIAAEMLTRMAFSALVDADYLDTENHFSPNTQELRGNYPSLAEYQDTLSVNLAQFANKPGHVNKIRAEILVSCKKAATNPKGGFRLTVPTGGGKTFSGLAFALDHAIANKMDRVIFAIPFTSIIEQTAEIYQSVFGHENVLEHHSAVEIADDEGQSESEVRRRLAAENWDCPLVVTTTVQLFESLLSNRPSRCRKLHNIANSVIVLDEVQSLPPERLKPILDVLHELVAHYGCSVVFCTATQPDYSNVDDRLWREAIELVPNYEDHFAALKRVSLQVCEEIWSNQRVAEEIESSDQVLAIFNSKKDAEEMARRCSHLGGIYHLSTLMCADHRRRTLAQVREHLDNGQPVRLISTQVVEAGVDVDFPFVMRHRGPLSSIVQAAGRCNREGRLASGTCLVFSMEDSTAPKGTYGTATAKTDIILQEYIDPMSPEAMGHYFRDFLQLTKTDLGIQEMRRALAFADVAKAFQMIDDDTQPVIIENYPFFDVGKLLAMDYLPPRLWFRRLAPFTVQIRRSTLDRLVKAGQVRMHDLGAWIYSGPYDRLIGFSPDLLDSTDLVIG